MTNWTDFNPAGGSIGERVTTWVYDLYRGQLKRKVYAGETDTTDDYEYTAGGRLSTRRWERGVNTTYGYTVAGDLQTVDYSDTTPDVTYTYDRRGRRLTAVCNGITTTWTYNDADQPLTETHTGGTLAGLAMTWTYDTSLRVATVTPKNGANVLQYATYAYDNASRLQSVTDGTNSVTYAYHANSSLINTLTSKTNSDVRLTTTRAHDKLNRLTSIGSVPSGASAVSFAYQYNAANQRTRVALADGSCWVYQYDALGQVVSGNRFWPDGTAVAGQQFEYRFDEIGNRDRTGGRASAVSDYDVNARNQYTQRTVPAYVDVLGVANPTANVTVEGIVASRKGEYFHHALSVASPPQYPTIDVVSAYGAGQTEQGEAFVPASPEVFGHDLDGNLTSDGRWTYTWDGENRLIELKRDVASPSGARQKLVFEYDHQGRRIRKTFYTYGTDWSEQRDTICLYDGWNVLAELNANSSNARLRTYVWGTDLSGTLQGAGGVGGLLWVFNYQASFDGQSLPAGVQFAGYDGNGNLTVLVKATTDGSVSARYEYGPFGEPVRVAGAFADAQPFRFSTKWTDLESGFLYYGYRYYNPTTGRWLSRDPIGEKAGKNLHAFPYNNTVNRIDRLGLTTGKLELDCAKRVVDYRGLNTAPAGYNSSCCGEQAWKDGLAALIDRYNQGVSFIDHKGLKRNAEAEGHSGKASCDDSNEALMMFMGPTPACWVCYMENRIPFVAILPEWLVGEVWDENAIVCAAIGSTRKVVFDWFAMMPPAQDYSTFQDKYFWLGFREEPRAYNDCGNKEEDVKWQPDVSRFNKFWPEEHD